MQPDKITKLEQGQMLPNRIICYSAARRGATYCPKSNHNFADHMVTLLVEVLKDYEGCIMNIGGYTPPYKPGTYPEGFLDISLYTHDLPEVAIGIVFGEKNPEGYPVRREFESEAWQRERHNPLLTNLTAINFDEAWRIVCLLGHRLKVQSLTLSYGT